MNHKVLDFFLADFLEPGPQAIRLTKLQLARTNCGRRVLDLCSVFVLLG